jgi:uncharacterized protein YbaP (TraB family)
MQEAVFRFIEDGEAVAMGAALEAAIPFSVGHEIIRQRKKDLTLIGPISDMLFDQMILQRNKNWAPKIEGFLNRNGNVLIIVGAAHLVGKNGVIEMLRQKGYVLEQL